MRPRSNAIAILSVPPDLARAKAKIAAAGPLVFRFIQPTVVVVQHLGDRAQRGAFATFPGVTAGGGLSFQSLWPC